MAHRDWTIELGELDVKLGIVILEQSPERMVATMPVEGNRQGYGLLHGGASAAFAEMLGSWAAVLHAGEGRTAVGVDLNVTHHRGVRSGTVTGVATAIRLGRKIASHEVVVTDEEGKRVCTARITNLILDEAAD
ncbi:hotdog fold thioesterase [Diaminobutyricibacter tongyongensis]|uniref:Hotdog fold thioesterase n=1 Tax=Leifsonia tongyongensis TaxID=1268043 RepID=A0A6L9XSK8_9MICO|nr:hotdog fold thioesterase [Diaminobutyricibacter tongyongensis]NEN04275.1 hotdog fold thioesterase [Diaminobutyricibacter tongyongensis]